jgi:hypothetical protein
LKKRNSPFSEMLLVFSATINFLSGLFHLLNHRLWPFGAANFLMAAAIFVFYVFLKKARLHFERAMARLHLARASLEEVRAMEAQEFVKAQDVAMKTLVRFARAVGATVMPRGFEPPSIHNPDRVPMDAEVRIQISEWQYIIVYGTIYRQNRVTGAHHSTCYHSNERIPPADMILCALLLLRNDPTIFERWCRQDDYYS